MLTVGLKRVHPIETKLHGPDFFEITIAITDCFNLLFAQKRSKSIYMLIGIRPGTSSRYGNSYISLPSILLYHIYILTTVKSDTSLDSPHKRLYKC